MRLAALLAGVLLTTAGSCADPTPTPDATEPAAEAPTEASSEEAPVAETPTDPVVLTSRADLAGARGARVVVSGTVQREKPGDAIVAEGLDLLCPDFRFADEQVGAVVTVEGTLGKQETPAATVGPNGEISQGPSMPTVRWVLSGCTLR